MAIGNDIIKTAGRLVIDLQRGGDKTTRTLDIAYPITDTAALQEAVNAADSLFASNGSMSYFFQPATWRDSNVTEEQWQTTGIHYEIVTTAITPIEPDEVLSATMAKEEEQQEREERGEVHEQEQNDQQQNEPQGEWQG